MKPNCQELLTPFATTLLVYLLFSTAAVAEQQTNPAMSESVRVEVEKLDDSGQAYRAALALADRGSTIVPELIVALEETLRELAQYDPRNLGDDKETYMSLERRQALLMGLVGGAGRPEDVDQLVDMIDMIGPENIMASSYFEMLDALGAQQEADSIALRIIADPASDGMKLISAMYHYYWRTPAVVADSAVLHLDNEVTVIRAIVYQLLINAGRADEIRSRLVDDVGRLKRDGNGIKQMLQALAVIEKPEVFLPRIEHIESVNVYPHEKRTATLVNRFAWSGLDERKTMIPDMLQTHNSELDMHAIKFMLDNNRVDLLEKYRLAWPATTQIEYYELLIPGFAAMSRERLLQHLPPKRVDLIERQRGLPLFPMTSPTMRPVLRNLGYSLEKIGDVIVIIPPVD